MADVLTFLASPGAFPEAAFADLGEGKSRPFSFGCGRHVIDDADAARFVRALGQKRADPSLFDWWCRF